MCRPDNAMKMRVLTTGVVQLHLAETWKLPYFRSRQDTHSSQACQVVHAPCRPNCQSTQPNKSPQFVHCTRYKCTHTRGTTAADGSDSTHKRTPTRRLSNLHMHKTPGRAHPAGLHQSRAGPRLCTQTSTLCPHGTAHKQDRHKGHHLAAMHVTGAGGHAAQLVCDNRTKQPPHNTPQGDNVCAVDGRRVQQRVRLCSQHELSSSTKLARVRVLTDEAACAPDAATPDLRRGSAWQIHIGVRAIAANGDVETELGAASMLHPGPPPPTTAPTGHNTMSVGFGPLTQQSRDLTTMVQTTL